MIVFDIGFYDGNDTAYYLERGDSVVAYEANPVLVDLGKERFREAIDAGRLQLFNCGVGSESGSEIDFFVNRENLEWSTFYREAALNWGSGKYDIIKVPCITPSELFNKHGIPSYLKVDIEGYDIFVASHLKNLSEKPEYVSFEASNRMLLRHLLLAGYQSYKLVDQATIQQQSALINGLPYQFQGSSTGAFGDDAPGVWLYFENMMYLYFRFEGDLFATSLPKGHWWDIHAGRGEPGELSVQLDWMKEFIDKRFSSHCGLYGNNKPGCPYTLSGGQ